MKPFTILASIILAFSTLLLSCEKEKEPKEQLTTVNGNTFGALLNGTAFIPDYYDAANNVHGIRIHFWYSPTTRGRWLQLIAQRRNGDFVEVYLSGPFSTGRRLLKTTTYPYPLNGMPPDYARYAIASPSKDFITNSTIGGYIEILNIDTVNKKVEARFEFTGTEGATGEQVKISNGYFKNF